MGTLTGNNISQTYKGLIKLADSTTGVTSVTQSFQDGLGNNIPIQVSQTVVNISGSLLVNGVPITGSTGSSGTSGSSGSSGINGTSGTSGSSGISGTDGSSGSSGVSGTSGTSGSSGVNGTSGTSGSSGVNGTSGTSGVSGTSGTSGSSGLSNSFFNYQAKTTITSGDPLSGHLIWNNATQTGATSISLSELDLLGNNVDVFLGNLASGSTITIQDKNIHTNYQIWKIGTGIDNSTYWTFPVTLLSSTYSFSNNQDVLFIVVTTPSGTSGTSGSSGSNGSSGTSGINGSSGTSGSNGSSGSSGTSGNDGSSGTSGSNGSSGTSGTSPDSSQFITTGSISTTQNITGSLILSGSINNITLSGSIRQTIPFIGTGTNAAVTNSFVGNTEITGSGTGTNALRVSGSGTFTRTLTVGVAGSTVGGQIQVRGRGAALSLLNSTGSVGVLGTASLNIETDDATILQSFIVDANHFETKFADYNNDGLNYNKSYWLSIGRNISGSNPIPQLTRGLGITGSLNITGSIYITGSVQGNVNPQSINFGTASIDLSQGNFFTLQLVSGSATHISPTNIKPGQTINLLLNTTGSGTVSFPSSVKQVSGSSYVPTTTTGVDIVTLISFDASSLYLANVKNLI